MNRDTFIFGFVLFSLIGLFVFLRFFYKKADDGDAPTVDMTACTPETPLLNVTDYELDEDGECVIKTCFGGYELNSAGDECRPDLGFDPEDPAPSAVKNEIRQFLTEQAEGRTFVTAEEISRADLDTLANGFVNNCGGGGFEQCAEDFVDFCDADPIATSNPHTGLDCDYIVDERIGVACEADADCAAVVEQCQEGEADGETCAYVPADGPCPEGAECGDPILRTCTRVPGGGDAKYCF